MHPLVSRLVEHPPSNWVTVRFFWRGVAGTSDRPTFIITAAPNPTDPRPNLITISMWREGKGSLVRAANPTRCTAPIRLSKIGPNMALLLACVGSFIGRGGSYLPKTASYARHLTACSERCHVQLGSSPPPRPKSPRQKAIIGFLGALARRWGTREKDKQDEILGGRFGGLFE